VSAAAPGPDGGGLRIGIVANEPSGDQLGAALIRSIRERRPEARFEGVGGPRMLAAGCASLVPMERLSVMGLVEVLRHLPELLAIRRRLAAHFLARPPDVFVGVDAPDFNLGLEARLRRAGIKTVHYVSPTVWAWRPGRVKTIRRAVDLMLSIFPFETEFLCRRGVRAEYVGHPLAFEIPLQPDAAGARERFGLSPEVEVIAVLPGSRIGEVEALAPVFVEAARWCLERRPGLRFLAPLVSPPIRGRFEAILRARAPRLPIGLVDGDSRSVLAAADLVLTASGTATLEALLHKRPMVVAYRLHPVSYALAKGLRLVKVPYIALANLLAGEPLAPELIQGACRPERIGRALLGFLEDPERMAAVRSRYLAVHESLRTGTPARAAEAVLDLAGAGGGWSAGRATLPSC
jgi:lipid-A-disaccharide synthase